jgi:S-adenosylmethionine:tRNA-ribosyltransferase-isomerase (queuine synthetase)
LRRLIRDSEKALHLREYTEMVDGVFHRYQEVAVVRNDKMHKESSPIPFSTCEDFNILAAVQIGDRIEPAGETVGELRDMAEAYREQNFMQTVLAEQADKSTLIEDYHKFNEMKRQLTKTHSRTINSLRSYANG